MMCINLPQWKCWENIFGRMNFTRLLMLQGHRQKKCLSGWRTATYCLRLWEVHRYVSTALSPETFWLKSTKLLATKNILENDMVLRYLRVLTLGEQWTKRLGCHIKTRKRRIGSGVDCGSFSTLMVEGWQKEQGKRSCICAVRGRNCVFWWGKRKSRSH